MTLAALVAALLAVGGDAWIRWRWRRRIDARLRAILDALQAKARRQDPDIPEGDHE